MSSPRPLGRSSEHAPQTTSPGRAGRRSRRVSYPRDVVEVQHVEEAHDAANTPPQHQRCSNRRSVRIGLAAIRRTQCRAGPGRCRPSRPRIRQPRLRRARSTRIRRSPGDRGRANALGPSCGRRSVRPLTTRAGRRPAVWSSSRSSRRLRRMSLACRPSKPGTNTRARPCSSGRRRSAAGACSTTRSTCVASPPSPSPAAGKTGRVDIALTWRLVAQCRSLRPPGLAPNTYCLDVQAADACERHRYEHWAH
jgi:hypothetical protein